LTIKSRIENLRDPQDLLLGSDLFRLIKEAAAKCNECPLCRQECTFLRRYGSPKEIAGGIDPQDGAVFNMAYECSLCGLCEAVCPVDLKPQELFLEMRREAVRQGQGEFPKHKALLKYEKRGTSKRYTWYGLPQGCDTVLFPGCALPGARPETVIRLFEHLKRNRPDLGIVLDCCAKPSHDLGRDDYFQALFGEMRGYLVDNGIRIVLVACPNCYMMVKEFGEPLRVQTVYEFLAEDKSKSPKGSLGTVSIHDPCVTRFETPIHEAVRTLIRKRGGTIEEMEHQGAKTLCCGEGGAVGFLFPGLANNWAALRKKEAQGRRMITYCAGCVNHLSPLSPPHHILDLFFQPRPTLDGKNKSSRSPWTYWNRLRLKQWVKKNVPAVVSREREFILTNIKPSNF
jgi:Fe-S oxidoreductase